MPETTCQTDFLETLPAALVSAAQSKDDVFEHLCPWQQPRVLEDDRHIRRYDELARPDLCRNASEATIERAVPR